MGFFLPLHIQHVEIQYPNKRFCSASEVSQQEGHSKTGQKEVVMVGLGLSSAFGVAIGFLLWGDSNFELQLPQSFCGLALWSGARASFPG